MALAVFECRVAARLKAGLPIVERPACHMCPPTGSGDIVARLPGLKQEFALIGSRARKVNRRYPK